MSDFFGGVGLRTQHYPYLQNKPTTQVNWFEAISENYMSSQGRPLKMLELIRQDHPVALHGVSLSIGSEEPVQKNYLQKLKVLVEHIEPFIVSDHMCWTGFMNNNAHDLLPFALTTEALVRIENKINQAQDILGRSMIFENLSAYIAYEESTYIEAEFLAEMCCRTGCGILLDVNNVYVNSQNFKFNAREYFDQIPPELIQQIHLAGFSDQGDFLFDTHSAPVFSEVWELFKYIVKKLKNKTPILIEWDENIPEFTELEKELLMAKTIWQQERGENETRSTPELHY